MLKVIKYIGKDRDESEWEECPFETQAEANKLAKAVSREFPKALFSVEDDGKVVTYWWQGNQRTEREIEIRRKNHQWSY